MIVRTSLKTPSRRRAARRVGLVARKSRWRLGTIDNLVGYMLIEPYRNLPVACSSRRNLSAGEVIDYCAIAEAMRDA